MKQLNCKLYYRQLHLKHWCNCARYWLQAVWGWQNSVETCSGVILCETIVCFCWFRVQNNNKKTCILLTKSILNFDHIIHQSGQTKRYSFSFSYPAKWAQDYTPIIFPATFCMIPSYRSKEEPTEHTGIRRVKEGTRPSCITWQTIGRFAHAQGSTSTVLPSWDRSQGCHISHCAAVSQRCEYGTLWWIYCTRRWIEDLHFK